MADSSRFSFLRFFGASNRTVKTSGSDHEDSQLRRTRSLCEGRANVPVGFIRAGFHKVPSVDHSQRLTGTKRRLGATPNASISSMDRSNLPVTAFSSLVPLPVEVVQLCESAFGKLFHPYHQVRWTLLDQIRRVFYADCHGDVQQLCHSFLAPAANLLDAIRKGSKEGIENWKNRKDGQIDCSWPLCSQGKVIIHLTELDRSSLPAGKLGRGDFYFHISRPCQTKSPNWGLCLCLKLRTLSGEALEVRIPPAHLSMAFSQKWFQETIFRSSDTRLLSALQFCVVSFERSIDRIELQLLASGLRMDQRLPSSHSDAVATSDLPLSAKDNELLSSACLVADECQCLCGIINSSSQSTTADDSHFHHGSERRSSYHPFNGHSPFPAEADHQSDLNKSIQPGRGNLIRELHSELMLSGGMIFPGIVDRQQHPVVFVFAHRFPAAVNSGNVTDLLGYFHSVAREIVSKNGFTLVVDMSPAVCKPVVDSQDAFLKKLDTAIHHFEEKIASGVHRVLIIVQSETPIEMADQIRDVFIKTSSGKITFVHGKDDLRMQIDDTHILTELDGRLSFSHQKFVAYRTAIEPFIETCRQASRRLLEAIQELKLQDRCVCQCGSSKLATNPRQPHTITAAHFNVMIQAQKKMMQFVLEDEHLLKLQTDGDAMLQHFQQEQSSREAKDSYDQASQIYNEVHTAAVKLARLADKRLSKLEHCFHLKALEEDSRKVLSWIRKKGEETLQRHSIIGDNLTEVRQQQQELEKFYFTASKQLEKAGDLLEEFHTLEATQYPAAIGELSRCLREYHKKFSDRLDDTRDRIDDAARCYCLVERAFEWTLSTINFMSQFRLEPNHSLDFLNEQLKKMERYIFDHPILSKENFSEMDQIAGRLKISKLTDKSAMARLRCQEAESMAITKETLFLKAKFALVPAMPSQDLLSRLPARRDLISPYDFSKDSNLHRNSTFRQASIPEMDETSTSSDTPFIDADSSGGTDSVPLGSACSSSTTEGDLPCSDTLSCGDAHSSGVEWRREKGNMRRSQTWQGAENSVTRVDLKGHNDSTDENYTDEDFSDASNARLNRRESWTIPTSNSHLSICLPKDPANPARPSDAASQYGNSASMTLQELVQTEIDYISALKFVIDNYLPEVFKDSVPQMLRGKGNVVFGNITKIYDFHKNDFLGAVSHCENSPFHLGQVFHKFEKQFYLYALYTHNKPKSDELMSECGNLYFKTRQNKLHDKMDLSSYLLKPVQRMVKYAGLLKQLLKLCPRADPEWERLQEAEEMVKFQLRHGNDLLAMDLLRDCDVNIKEQGRLCRQDDMLVWVAGKKRFRRVFLFEEIILFSKVKRDKNGSEIYQYKNSLKTSDLGLTEQLGDSLTRFEIWFRKRKLGDNYILQASNGEEKQWWTKDISAILWSQAIKGREARLVEMNSMGIEKKTCLDIKPSEDQINHRYVNLRQQGNSSTRGSVESLRSGRNQRPHSVISVSSGSTLGSTLISSPVQTTHWAAASTSVPEDTNESPRRSQCSSESGIGLDMANSSSPVDSDSSK